MSTVRRSATAGITKEYGRTRSSDFSHAAQFFLRRKESGAAKNENDGRGVWTRTGNTLKKQHNLVLMEYFISSVGIKVSVDLKGQLRRQFERYYRNIISERILNIWPIAAVKPL